MFWSTQLWENGHLNWQKSNGQIALKTGTFYTTHNFAHCLKAWATEFAQNVQPEHLSTLT